MQLSNRMASARYHWSSICLCSIIIGFLTLVAGTANAFPAAVPPTSDTISIEIDPVDPTLGSAVPAFLDEVSNAFAAHGFTVLEGAGHARFVAALSLSRTDVGTTTAKVPVERSSVSAGGGPGVGGMFTVPLPTTKTGSVPLQQTRLEIRIHERDAAAILWHGAAVAVRAAATRTGQEAGVASDLIDAMLRTYPDQSDGVASVP